MKKFTTLLSWKPKPNRKPRFFFCKTYQNRLTGNIWNCNNTSSISDASYTLSTLVGHISSEEV